MSRGCKLGGSEQGEAIKACVHLVYLRDLAIQHTTTAGTNGANVSIWWHDKTRILFSHVCFTKISYYLNKTRENTFSMVFYHMCSFTSGGGFPSKMGAGASEAWIPSAHSLTLIFNGVSDALPSIPSKQKSIKIFKCFQHFQCKCQDSAPKTLNKYSWWNMKRDGGHFLSSPWRELKLVVPRSHR